MNLCAFDLSSPSMRLGYSPFVMPCHEHYFVKNLEIMSCGKYS